MASIDDIWERLNRGEHINFRHDPDFNQVVKLEVWRSTGLSTLISGLDPYGKEARQYLNELFDNRLPVSVEISPPLRIDCAKPITINEDTVISYQVTMMGYGGIKIGKRVMIGPNVTLITVNHDLKDKSVIFCAPITIKDDAWLGAGVTVLPGVTIGYAAVIGAAAVVTKDVPDYAVVVGNPARVIKSIN